MKCNHYACRCARSRELAAMSDRTGDPRLMFEAANLGEVECRVPDDPHANSLGIRPRYEVPTALQFPTTPEQK